jgi:anionic cell wall polymer biosynthesis LytR-Cps2A-Psr (LCP) family protein
MRRLFKFLITFFIALTIISVLLFLNASFEISKSLGQPTNYLIKTIYQASKSNPYLSKDKLNFIILGLDERNDSLEVTQTTDTIMFASFNLKTSKINTISLPRDLWSYDINAKINEIYPLSLKESDKFSFIKDKFKKIINQDIDHVVVMSTDNLIEFVKIIGGVDINLEQGFVDKQYPNPEYIKTPSKDIPIYKTIEFKSGPIHLDESNITEFVRSRHGGETVAQGGTDLARIKRQQLLIEAIIVKIKSGQFIQTESQITSLYKFWNQSLIKDITDVSALQIVSVASPNLSNLSLNKIELEIGETAKTGVIYHPIKFTNKQWVYLPVDDQYQKLQEFIKTSIN